MRGIVLCMLGCFHLGTITRNGSGSDSLVAQHDSTKAKGDR